MSTEELHPDLHGWWRITETSRWGDESLDRIGPAMFSITGSDDRLRMHLLLADLTFEPTKLGASFTWEGAWENDQLTGTGSVKLGKDGTLRGKLKIRDGDESTFVARKADKPSVPIPDPPSYWFKWRGR